MVKKRRLLSGKLRHFAALFAIPAVLITTGYALFSQDLSVNGSSASISYNSSQNMVASYTISSAPQGQKLIYTMVVTVKNNGASAVESWQLAYDLPADYSQRTCVATVVCTNVGARLTINNGTGNGTVNPGATVTFNISFTSSVTSYSWQNVNISGVTALVYQTVPGLTVSRTIGTQVKVGKRYDNPYTFTVSNNSGQYISRWRIYANWSSSSNTVVSMATTVNYVAGATQLTIMSITGVNNGSNFVFNATLSSTSRTWTLTGLSIQGAI